MLKITSTDLTLGLVAISTICGIGHTVWTYSFFHRMKPQDYDSPEARAETLHKFRNRGFLTTAIQVALLIGILGTPTPGNAEIGLAALLLFVAMLLAQGQASYYVERKIRGLEVKHRTVLLQTFKGLAAMTAMYGVYYLVAFGTGDGLQRLGSWAGLSSDSLETLSWAGIFLGVLAGLAAVALISPLIVRMMMPCAPLEDPEAAKTLERCFDKAGLNKPTFWILKLDRFKAHNAMVSGFQKGRGWFRPALFFTKSLLEELTLEEFEAIILHEVSHISLKHIPKRLLAGFFAFCIAFVPYLLVTSALILVLPPAYMFLAALLCMVVNIGLQIYVVRQVVRRQELEADENAVRLGASVESFARALEKLTILNDQSTKKKDHSSRLDANAAHPTTEARIQILRQRAAQGFPPWPSIWNEVFAPLKKHYRIAVPSMATLGVALAAYGWLYAKPRIDLYYAASSGDVSKLQRLIESDKAPNLNDHTPLGDFPLYVAAAGGHLPAVRFLVEHGADVNQADARRKATSLMAAAYAGHTEVVGYLADKGADINARSRRGETALIGAAYGGREECIRLLLELGAPVDQTNYHRSTALTIAAENGKAGIVKLLIEKGAFVDAKDNDGDSSLGLAKQRRHAVVVQLLEKAGASDLGRYKTAERGLAGEASQK